ncbi:hypothetical protein FRC11_000649 [Ceratobasidium sp. 423]|nr:hypothetical protein FRC11_000649 [Ceratobasidium sp. 423]
MDNPTHADAFLNLLSSCFPSGCRSNPPALPPSPRLGALLRDPESDDAMSLHSTYRPHTRQKKKKPAMQLCGVNLFGKPRGQIRLEDDDDEPPISRPRPRYDSDAAPLPDSTIQSLSGRSPTTEQPTRQESPEQELARLRAEKAARKARRRERKLKRQLALEQTGEFEGFIGSGDGRDGFPISPPSTTTSTPGIEDLLDGSDRGSSRLVDEDPEDGDADMGAAVYTRSTRSRSESGSSATRSSRARDELVPGNALGLRGPPSPLAQSHIPEASEPVDDAVPSRAEPEQVQTRSEPEPITKTEPILKTEPIAEPKPVTEPKPRPKPKIHISDMPLSSPGAGPGPRTLENSPRLAGLGTLRHQEGYETPRHEEGYFPHPSPRLGLPPPRLSGFPSSGLSRKGFPSPGLGKSHGSGAGLGLNYTSAGSGGFSSTNGSGDLVDASGSSLAGGNVFDGGSGDKNVLGDRDGRGSGDAGSQRSSGDGDGGGSVGGGQSDRSGNQGRGGRITAGMGVALANRG